MNIDQVGFWISLVIMSPIIFFWIGILGVYLLGETP